MNRLIIALSACLALLLGWLGMASGPRDTLIIAGQPSVNTGQGNSKPVAAAARPEVGPAVAGKNTTPPALASRVPCMSYAPYRRAGDAPWHVSRPIDPEKIREDLRLLMPLTRCVRTYGVEHGLEAVPAIARELGFKVRLGVWIGGDRAGNQAHLERGIALARDYRDVVDLLIVGNEVLLRGELPIHELTALLDQARGAQPVPVAYADVWEFWQRHGPALKGHVDVAAIHILPYWEDHPVGIDGALAHVQFVLQTMQHELAPLPVWLAETGWPSAGRQRGPARPGLTEQAKFMREWAQLARENDNLIEAFDQPWKRDLEGAMGGHWGMLDAQGRAKFDWTGTLPPGTPPGPALTALLAGALLAGVFGFMVVRRAVAAGLAGACLGPLVLFQVEMIQIWGRTPFEILAASAYALLCLTCAVLAVGQCLTSRRVRGLQVGIMLVLLCTCGLALALVLDGRYRPLVWPLQMAPAVALLLPVARPIERIKSPGLRRAILLLSSLCLICGGWLLVQEGWVNTQALYCALGWVLLALGSLRRLRATGSPG